LSAEEIRHEKWRRVWREGLAPQLSLAELFALWSALIRDDPRLLQGVVSSPPPLEPMADCRVVGCCAVGYGGWRSRRLHTVAQVEANFHRTCDAADAVFHEPAACRFFLNWYDETPRPVMRRELLAEVTLALRQRAPVAA
jgi:hypothetical protein